MKIDIKIEDKIVYFYQEGTDAYYAHTPLKEIGKTIVINFKVHLIGLKNTIKILFLIIILYMTLLNL
jgi:hypothetical protein